MSWEGKKSKQGRPSSGKNVGKDGVGDKVTWLGTERAKRGTIQNGLEKEAGTP